MTQRHRDSLMAVSTFAIISLAMWSMVRATPAATDKATVSNPHWSADRCNACHDDSSPPQEIDQAAAEKRCVECHDGRHASKEVHPIGRTFENEQVELPKGWPVVDGRLGCLTCHDVVMACDKEKKRPAKNSAMLRQYDPAKPTAFCGQCHTAAAEATGGRYSPHVMFDDKGEIQEQTCRFCHEKTFDLKAALKQKKRTGKAGLRANELTLCGSCHRRHKDWFEPGHIGLVATDEIKANIERTDPSKRLPLGQDNRIVCSTCHNPHQSGVFAAHSQLGRGGMKPHVDSTSTTQPARRAPALRGFSKELCRECHRK